LQKLESLRQWNTHKFESSSLKTIAPFIQTIEIPHFSVMNQTKGSLSTDYSSLEADTRKADQGIFFTF